MELTEKQVLSTVEGLCLNADTEEITMCPKDHTEKEVRLAELVDTIYRLVHCIKGSCCHESHADWREDAVEIRKNLIASGIIGE